ncbi:MULTISPECIES: hypothetical protein [unclassified Arthrobacter]|uniref:hypothetical protein n=1 Tax=unclassified Arthrobacter TaxID=235627 RepID=UPI000CE559B0|nr:MULTISPECIES: hypothetical protein [unclassified Arthrobacter]
MQERSSKSPRLAAAALLIFSLGGCTLISEAGTPDPSTAPSRPAAQVLPELETILPDLMALGGEASPLAVQQLKEESCLDPLQEDNWNTQTRALGWLVGRFTDHESAQGAMDAWKSHLETGGWVQDDELRNAPETNGDVHVMRYHHEDLQLSARYDHAELNSSRNVSVVITSPCMKNPEDHRMTRSKLDPDYGVSSKYYDSDAEKADPA